MARRNRREEDLERDDDPIANLLAPVPVPAPAVSPGYNPFGAIHDVLQDIEDRRTFHPDGYFRQALDLSATPAPARMRDTRSRTARYQVPALDHNRHPVLVCVRRKQRREVIFAMKKNGKGARARRRRRNYYSNVRC